MKAAEEPICRLLAQSQAENCCLLLQVQRLLALRARLRSRLQLRKHLKPHSAHNTRLGL